MCLVRQKERVREQAIFRAHLHWWQQHEFTASVRLGNATSVICSGRSPHAMDLVGARR